MESKELDGNGDLERFRCSVCSGVILPLFETLPLSTYMFMRKDMCKGANEHSALPEDKSLLGLRYVGRKIFTELKFRKRVFSCSTNKVRNM